MFIFPFSSLVLSPTLFLSHPSFFPPTLPSSLQPFLLPSTCLPSHPPPSLPPHQPPSLPPHQPPSLPLTNHPPFPLTNHPPFPLTNHPPFPLTNHPPFPLPPPLLQAHTTTTTTYLWLDPLRAYHMGRCCDSDKLELLGDNVEAPEPLSSLDPLDTIFVKHVRPGSPAHLSGLRTGDRVVSVNGESVGSRSYQEVVATIHRSPPLLQLVVVPREQDLLQQVFGETAHNPESNLDVRMPSPSHLPPQQLLRHPGAISLTQPVFGALPAQYPPSLSSAWSSQSSLASHPSAMSTGTHPQAVIMAHPSYHSRPNQPSKVSQPHGAHIPILPHHHGNQSSVPYRASSRKHSLSGGGEKQPTSAPGNRKQSLPGSADRRQAIYTIQNTISAVPHQVPSGKTKSSPSPVSTNNPHGNGSSIPLSDPNTGSVFGVYEPILDRAVGRGSFRDNRRLERDPDGRIYEVVQTKVVESQINSGDAGKKGMNQSKGHHQGSHIGRKTSLGSEVDAKRVRVQSLSPPRLKMDHFHTRSVSVHTRPEGLYTATGNDGSIHGSQQSLDSTKSEVLIRSSNKPNSYSRRSYTEPLPSNKENCHSNDKSTQDVINRIKKNVERKEEFLKRPNQPIWLPASKPPVIHYHVNPQKLQKPLWPPPSAQTPPSPGAVTKALSFVLNAPKQDLLPNAESDKESNEKGENANGSQPSEDDGKDEYDLLDSEDPNNSSQQSSMQRSLVGNSVPKPYVGSSNEANPPSGARYGKGFMSTLTRIQENIPIPEHGSSSSLASQSRQSDTPPGSEKSFMTSVIRPIPLAWVGDNERIKQLQIVSKRAKQFENSKLEKEASGKSAFHRFELTRLSQRSKIPNVAQRKQEFEKRDSDQQPSGFDFEFGTEYTNSPRQRKSAELVRSNLVSKDFSPSPPKVFRSLSDGGTVFPVSRRLLNSGYGVLERERSNSVCSQASMSSLWSTQSMDETNSARQKSVARQNSYLSAVRSALPDSLTQKFLDLTNQLNQRCCLVEKDGTSTWYLPSFNVVMQKLAGSGSPFQIFRTSSAVENIW
ncbi:hypothetical protein Pcinc_033906 [Petrolisthes cinctipes]|uniref:PDZ domain-containing protein n=1 Tax=Petrolisthes cinctipes TaxID=88211 RepID=A0AAE1JXR7_PETCI|nr:hypothetical protein Pcinc_033906 [Petrolisthes cinctipes]